MRRRWKIVLAVAPVVVLLLAVFGISWFAGQALLHYPKSYATSTPSDVNLTWEWANFTNADGQALVGWFMPADATPADNATVIFLHGFGDTREQGLGLAPALVGAGYNMLAFDFRYFGDSEGSHTTAGYHEVRDVEAAVAWLKARPGFPEDPSITLLGWSMGGATAIRAAPDIPEVDGVIADGAFSKLQNIVDTSIGSFFREAIGFELPRWPFGPLAVTFAGWSVGIDIADNVPARAIAHIDGPVLLIQGEADETVLPDNVDQLLEASGGTAQVLRVPEAKHVECFATAPELYTETVLAFLESAMPADAP